MKALCSKDGFVKTFDYGQIKLEDTLHFFIVQEHSSKNLMQTLHTKNLSEAEVLKIGLQLINAI
jgi:hypothetical protein